VAAIEFIRTQGANVQLVSCDERLLGAARVKRLWPQALTLMPIFRIYRRHDRRMFPCVLPGEAGSPAG
jgi:hypothetical protein